MRCLILFSIAFYWNILNSQLFSSANIFNSQNWILTRILRVYKRQFRALIIRNGIGQKLYNIMIALSLIFPLLSQRIRTGIILW